MKTKQSGRSINRNDSDIENRNESYDVDNQRYDASDNEFNNEEDIMYNEKELEDYKSIRDVLKQREQFSKDFHVINQLERAKSRNDQEKNFLSRIKMRKNASMGTSLKRDAFSKIDQEPGTETKEEQLQRAETDSLEEMDPRAFKCHGKTFRFCRTALNCLDNRNFFRKICVWIVCWKWFDRLIISLIILNSLFLGIMDYTDEENKSWRNKLVEYSEPIFTVIFTFECLVKIFGTGLIIGQGTYLSDPWNWIDFLVVISGLLSSVPQMANVSGLRTFRLFRPLRSLSTLPNIRILIGTLLASVSQLGGVLSLALFFFLIFAILGVNLFAGLSNYRCYETPAPVNGDWKVIESDKRI